MSWTNRTKGWLLSYLVRKLGTVGVKMNHTSADTIILDSSSSSARNMKKTTEIYGLLIK